MDVILLMQWIFIKVYNINEYIGNCIFHVSKLTNYFTNSDNAKGNLLGNIN